MVSRRKVWDRLERVTTGRPPVVSTEVSVGLSPTRVERNPARGRVVRRVCWPRPFRPPTGARLPRSRPRSSDPRPPPLRSPVDPALGPCPCSSRGLSIRPGVLAGGWIIGREAPARPDLATIPLARSTSATFRALFRAPGPLVPGYFFRFRRAGTLPGRTTISCLQINANSLRGRLVDRGIWCR